MDLRDTITVPMPLAARVSGYSSDGTADVALRFMSHREAQEVVAYILEILARSGAST